MSPWRWGKRGGRVWWQQHEYCSPKGRTRVFCPCRALNSIKGCRGRQQLECKLLPIQLSCWALWACVFSHSMKAAFGVCTLYTCARVLACTPVCFPRGKQLRNSHGGEEGGWGGTFLAERMSVLFSSRLWSSAAIYLFINMSMRTCRSEDGAGPSNVCWVFCDLNFYLVIKWGIHTAGKIAFARWPLTSRNTKSKADDVEFPSEGSALLAAASWMTIYCI